MARPQPETVVNVFRRINLIFTASPVKRCVGVFNLLSKSSTLKSYAKIKTLSLSVDKTKHERQSSSQGGTRSTKLNEEPLNEVEARFREWRYKIPRDPDRRPPDLLLELPNFFRTAWLMFEDGSADMKQQIISLLAAGGLHRIIEAVTVIDDSSTSADRFDDTTNLLLPLLKILSSDSALTSPILESDVAKIHNVLFGVNGNRASTVYPALAQFFHTLDQTTEEGSENIIRVLTFFHKSIDINSTAKVSDTLRPTIEELSKEIPDGLLDGIEGRRLIDAIRSRMGLGKLMPSTTGSASTLVLPASARFHIQRDLPGNLSAVGSRHDNDHEDIAEIQIMPTSEEIESTRSEYLPVKDPHELHKLGLEGLLDRHFRLLREDTVGQLRDAVRLEFDKLQTPTDPNSKGNKSGGDIRRMIYPNICLEDSFLNLNGGLQFLVSFEQPVSLKNKSTSERRLFWERHLGKDALVCVLSDNGEVGFFCVCADVNMDDRHSEDARFKRLTDHRTRASTLLRLTEPFEHDITRAVQCLSHAKDQIRLCEFPGILLPSFYPTLTALQSLSETLDLPFSDLIAPQFENGFDGYVPPPKYSLKANFAFDLKAVAGGESLMLSPSKQFDYKALNDRSNLDDAQQIAVVEALTRSLALIQGPPGTGKSFTGVSLIKVLLDNAKKAKLGPIVCVCYTNHALDQLLEHLVSGGVKQIVRIGSRSKSESLKPLNLREVVKGIEQTATEKRIWAVAKQNLEVLATELSDCRNDFITPEMPTSATRVKKYLKVTNSSHFAQLFPSRKTDQKDEAGFQVVCRDGKRRDLNGWLPANKRISPRSGSESTQLPRSIREAHHSDLWNLNIHERQLLYAKWCLQIRSKASEKAAHILKDAEECQRNLTYCRQESDLRCLTQASVIGLTTSGLARNLNFLRRLKSKVLICEEAGEVLEAHLLTALLPSIEHAILIGDHRQLRPQIQNNGLKSEYSRGEQYSLDVSLFERLVQPNVNGAIKLPLSDLRTQRRMHPSISELVRETIYPNLQDDDHVRQYSLVEGIAKRLFWINHQNTENAAEREDSTSYSNDYEISFTQALVSHLVSQGKYKPSDVAVLTPYRGQFAKLRRKLSESFAIALSEKDAEEVGESDELQDDKVGNVQKSTLLQALRIATVDNFQGEEAKVVIISLVRSNNQRRCGFLKTSNRINVLLSRAQHGMYLIGDAETYRPVAMWDEIINMLERDSHARSLALLAASSAPGLAHIEVAASYLAQSLAIWCLARSGAKRLLTADIVALHYVARRVPLLSSAKPAVQTT
ncbi:MAG: hypothetical protein Q9227_007450 [Pyrenula ochraceoflavens]